MIYKYVYQTHAGGAKFEVGEGGRRSLPLDCYLILSTNMQSMLALKHFAQIFALLKLAMQKARSAANNAEGNDVDAGCASGDDIDMSCVEQPANPRVPIFEVAYRQGMWWGLPEHLSRELHAMYIADYDAASYTWDWGNMRAGSWKPEGQETTINRYTIDFRSWQQRNIDSGTVRSVRLVWVRPEDLLPQWTGEKP